MNKKLSCWELECEFGIGCDSFRNEKMHSAVKELLQACFDLNIDIARWPTVEYPRARAVLNSDPIITRVVWAAYPKGAGMAWTPEEQEEKIAVLDIPGDDALEYRAINEFKTKIENQIRKETKK